MRADRLPRWIFHATGVGCGVPLHDQHCLCDVQIDAPTPISAESGLLFGQMASDAVGGVSPETFAEFASVLLGCYEMFRAECVEWVPADDPETWRRDDEADDLPKPGTHQTPHRNTKKMGQLDATTRWMFRQGWKDMIPWSKVKLRLPVEFRHHRWVARMYSERLYHPQNRNRHDR